jgi:hypothetical protein
MGTKIINYFILFFLVFGTSRANADWSDLGKNEIPNPDSCGYRVVITTKDTYSSSNSYLELSDSSVSSVDPSKSVAVRLSFVMTNFDFYNLIFIIAGTEKSIFQTQYNDSFNIYDTKCTLVFTGDYAFAEKPRRMVKSATSDWVLACWSRAKNGGPGEFDNHYTIPGPVRLQKNC